MNWRLFIFALLSVWLLHAAEVRGQNANVRRDMEKTAKATLPNATRRIAEETEAKITLEVDTTSYGEDEKAWGNLNIIVNRVAAAIIEVGKDQIGKDAIATEIRRVLIVKRGDDAAADAIELKNGVLTVNTAGNDEAGTKLQGIITKGLEKALRMAPPPEATPGKSP